MGCRRGSILGCHFEKKKTAMLRVTGIGEQKLERYGDRFLDAIKKNAENTADGHFI